MDHGQRHDPVYALGRSEGEAIRLENQALFFRPRTRRLLLSAGIEAGMKVLDIGSGAGDVALIASEIVGPNSTVVGVDLNPAIVATSNARVIEAGVSNVSFKSGDVRSLDLEHDFDAVVGRFVLIYSADPVETLRAALRPVRVGGVAAFFEPDMGSAVASYPVSPLHQSLGRWVSETFARAGVELAMASKLYKVFVEAGLESPELFADVLVGGGEDWVDRFVLAFGSNLLRSLMPQILQFSVATEEQIDVESFDNRYRDEVLRLGSMIQWFFCIGAWAQKRAA